MKHLRPIATLVSAFLPLACAAPVHEVGAASSSRAPTGAAAGDGNRTIGEPCTDIGPSCWVVFHDRDDNLWFGTDGNGVFRYDGKQLTRFTTKDGLAHDQIRDIRQHAPTGHILFTTNGGVSRFDGQRFTTLPITQMQAPELASAAGAATMRGDLAKQGWRLDVDDVWLRGSRGPCRYDGERLFQLTLPRSPFEVEFATPLAAESKWNAYDVWTVYRNSARRGGPVWFGTAMVGVCRFDGESIDWLFEWPLTSLQGGGWFGFRAIREDRDGDVWICNTHQRYAIAAHAPDGQPPGKLAYTRKAGIDLRGSATTDELIYFQSITTDDQGNLWMAPYGGGVWKYDGRNVTHYPMTSNGAQITMIWIATDNHGGIWVGTHEHGAWRLRGDTFERFVP